MPQEQIRVCIYAANGACKVDFQKRLHRRGTDFSVFANTGYTPESRDEKHLDAVLTVLMSDRDSGVEAVAVRSSSLSITYTRAATFEFLRQRVLDALKGANFDVVEVDQDGQPLGSDEDRAVEAWYALPVWRRFSLGFSGYGPMDVTPGGNPRRSRTQLAEDYAKLPLWKRYLVRLTNYPFK